jgi:RimJ/RimL family protein N-acetyltransferase
LPRQANTSAVPRRNPDKSLALEDGRKVVLRPLRMVDVDAMTAFVNTLVREKKTNRELGIGSFDKRITRTFERKFLKDSVGAMKKRKAVFLGAFDGGKVVGECSIRGRESKDTGHTGLFGMVVLEGYRGIGLGRGMMSQALREARRLGIWLVELEVMAINEHAVRLYEKLGFRRVGVVPAKMVRDGKPLDVIVMYADLRGTDKSTSPSRRKS